MLANKTRHDYVGTVTTEPTCTIPGVKTYVCQNDASHTYTEEIPAPGHTAGADATCTEDQACTVCGEVLTPAPGHNYNAIVTPPTCEEDGYTTYTCTVCGDNYTADETDANGHAYVGTVTTEPTCTEPGVKTYICQNDASHTYTEEIPVTDHTWGDWTETIPATYTQEGEEMRTCEVCGTEEKRAIGKLPLPTKLIIYQPYTIAKESADGFAVVSIDTTVGELLAASNANAVLNKSGEAVSADTKLATGMVLAITDGETIIDSMEIVVLGDVSGDAQITSEDARLALRLAVGLETLDSAYIAAAKVTGSPTVVSNDARDILRASVGLDDPAAWFVKVQ